MDIFELAAKITLDTSEFEGGVDDAKGSFSSFKDNLSGAVKTATAITGTIAGIGGAAYAAASKVANYGDNIDKASQKMGVSADFYQTWDAVLQHSGTSMDSMSQTFKTLANAAQDASNDQIAAFEALGMSMEEVQNMSPEQLFESVISGLQDMEAGTERTALAQDLLGRGAQELGALLNTSAEDTQKMKDRVHELGGVMSDDAVKASAQFSDSLQDMKTAFSGASTSIISKFLPSITSLFDGITSFVENNDIPEIINGIVEKFEEFSPVIAGVTTAVVAFKTAMAISALIDGVKASIVAFQAANEGATLAQWLLNAAMNANPFVLIVTLIAGVVAAVIVLWNTNEDFRAACIAVFDAVKNAVQSFVNAVVNFFTATVPNAISALVSKFNEMLSKFLQLGKDIVDNIKSGFDSAKSTLINAATTLGQNVVDNIKNGIKSKWDGVVSWFKGIFDKAFGNLNANINVTKSDGTGSGGGSAIGMDYVPYDGLNTWLHRGEAVLTRTEAEDWRKGNSGNKAGITIVQNISAVPQTPVQLAAATSAYFEQARWAI